MKQHSIDISSALEIAQRQCAAPKETFEIYNSKPSNWNIYVPSDQDLDGCWFVRAQSYGTGLRSSRVIVVSKTTGDVLYDGSAGDEG